MTMTTTAPETHTGELALEITRVFNAPRDLVFKAWTDPEHMARWGGPEGFSATIVEMDARPGGFWRLGMRSPEGQEYLQGGVIREIVPPERLVYTFAWEEADGTPGHETVVSVTLAEHGPDAALTLMTFRQGTFENAESREGHREGWDSAFNVLSAYLESEAGAPA